jgi:peptidoglycan/xylan/chitin deacetylase (PgdA/CDA1 family)
MTPRSMLGGVRRRIFCSLYRRTVPIRNRRPIVSFTFDDFPRTAYLAGGFILQQFGLHGTYYAAPGLMATASEFGDQFRREDVDSLLESGHELASHTYSHISSRSVPCAQFIENVEKGRKAVEDLSGMVAGNFAYPHGDVTLAAKRSIGPSFDSCRSIIPGLNGPEIDLNLLLANRLYGDLSSCERAEALIAENVRKKSWLIFYTHDVRPNPSPYGCTPALLESVVAFAIHSGCQIMTVREALRALEIRSGNPEVQAPSAISA